MPSGRPTLQIITAAEAAGHDRITEMNRQVVGNLDKIITALEADGDGMEAGGGRRCVLTRPALRGRGPAVTS